MVWYRDCSEEEEEETLSWETGDDANLNDELPSSLAMILHQHPLPLPLPLPAPFSPSSGDDQISMSANY